MWSSILHRFASMAWLAKMSGAANLTGFEGAGNWHAQRTRLVAHSIGDGRHETERNHAQVAHFLGEWDPKVDRPRLYPTSQHQAEAMSWPSDALVLAPASVWATKRWPENRWAELADRWAARAGWSGGYFDGRRKGIRNSSIALREPASKRSPWCVQGTWIYSEPQL